MGQAKPYGQCHDPGFPEKDCHSTPGKAADMSPPQQRRRKGCMGMEHKTLSSLCQKGLAERGCSSEKPWLERLNYELSLIGAEELSRDFLILADFAAYLRSRDIPFSAGCGRANGCLTLFLLGGTDMDPITCGLSFDLFFIRPRQGNGLCVWFDFPLEYYNEAKSYAVDTYGQEKAKEFLPGFDGPSTWLFTGALSLMQKVKSKVEDHRGAKINLDDIPLNDSPTFHLISNGKTEDLFVLAGGLHNHYNCKVTDRTLSCLHTGDEMKKALLELKPACFQELMLVIAIFHHEYLYEQRDLLLSHLLYNKRNNRNMEYLFPFLNQSLGHTFGLLIYREQIHQILAKVSGFSVGKAESLIKNIMLGYRRKKNVSTYEAEKTAFIQSGLEHGYSLEQLESILSFISEQLNRVCIKANTANQALIFYRLAYFKANYPREFSEAITS